jgi:hypothetical protein
MSTKSSEMVCPECAVRYQVPKTTRHKMPFCRRCKQPLSFVSVESSTEMEPEAAKQNPVPHQSGVKARPAAATATTAANAPRAEPPKQTFPNDWEDSDTSGIQELDYESLTAHSLPSDWLVDSERPNVPRRRFDPVRLPEGGHRTLTKAEYDALHNEPSADNLAYGMSFGVCDDCGLDISDAEPDGHRGCGPGETALLKSDVVEQPTEIGEPAIANVAVELPAMLGPFRFGDWPVRSVPTVAAGVYAIWEEDRLVYVGMSGRGRSEEDLKGAEGSGRTLGLWPRLESHASGRRSGDQFCVYVADRLVLQTLTIHQLDLIASGELQLDDLVRSRVRDHMTFTFAVTRDGETASQLEGQLRSGAGGSKPSLNPT